MVERSVKEVFAPIDELRRKIMIFASLSTIFALAFSGSIAYSISVRIKRLKAATLANKNGRLFEVAVQGTDEVADLAKSFNGMVKDLNHATAELQSQASHLETQNDCLQEEIVQRKQFQAEREKLSMQLIEASRQAGMAEVATGVLHNVGNVLTNVNVSANLIMEQRKNSRLATLARAADVITEHEHDLSDFLADDERGKRFPSLLRSLTKSLAAEQSNELGELNNLISSIDHIRAIVNKQQTFAGSFGQMELVESGELVSDALSLTKEGFERHGIQLKLDNQSFVLVTDKHKVLQILVNLVNNAKAAISANPPGNRLIEIRSRLANGQWDINVGDNGCGISLENQQRVFQHGFTTKSDGHGFGLHHSAISAQSLGGSIAMKSDGEGLGTTFTLTLPVKKEELCTS